MRVKELIDNLQKYDPDMKIVFPNGEFSKFVDIATVTTAPMYRYSVDHVNAESTGSYCYPTLLDWEKHESKIQTTVILLTEAKGAYDYD